MIVVTGGAGFIGSNLIRYLNERDIRDIIVVDNLGTGDKWKNLIGLDYCLYIDKNDFFNSLSPGDFKYGDYIVHLGACTDTTEQDMSYLMKNNYEYTLDLYNYSIENNLRFIYASSASTYGSGENTFSDNHKLIPSQIPTSKYAFSKHIFDTILYNSDQLDSVVGLKFFNVFGPNEDHKNNMSSVIHKSIKSLKEDNIINIFEGTDNYSRDFIYVRDVVKVIMFFINNWNTINKKGIFNIGSGINTTWKELAIEISKVMGLDKAPIKHTHFPKEYIKHYQKFTKADISKLREVGYKEEFMSIESALKDYIQD